MPKVPTYDSFQVDSGNGPSARFETGNINVQQASANISATNPNYITPDMAAAAGRQQMQFGQAQQKLGESLANIAMDVQKEANALRVDDAVNRAKEEAMRLTYDKDVGFSNTRGLQALERASGKPLADEYGDTLAEQLAKIRDGLGNDAQKQAFAGRANDMLTTFKGQAIQHEAIQFREYALSVREGTIANRMQELALAYNNPQVVDEALTSIKAATYDQARLLGKSAEWAEAQSRKMTSNALVTAVGAALDKNDIAYADGLMKHYAKDMDANDLLRVGGLVTKEMDNRVGLQVASGVMSAASRRMVTQDGDRAFNILIGTESGGQQFDAKGQPLTSSKGAIGVAQVMPTTGPEAAKLAGLPWDEQRFKTDAQYNQALGRAYFNKQLQDFGGNLAYAYAAYNAGPGALREALKKAESAQSKMEGFNARITAYNAELELSKKGMSKKSAAELAAEGKAIEEQRKTIGSPNWLDNLPAETQKYVTKNMKEYSAGQGAYQKPTLSDIHNDIRNNPLVANNPTRLKTALDDATRQYEVLEKSLKAQEEQGLADAYRALQANGGRWSELPPAIRNAVPPGKVDEAMNYGARIAKGDDITDKALYQKLATDRAYLTGLSDNQFYALSSQLSRSDFEHFARERGQIISGKPGDTFQDLNTEAINSTLNARLSQLRIDPTPKDGSSAAERVGAIRMFVRGEILKRQQQNGKKMSDAETSSFIDELFAKNVIFSGMLGDYKANMMNMTVGNIPSDIKKRIKSDLKAGGNSEPTDGQILEAYFKLTYATQGK